MLKALELVGFKSFADKTRFEFPQGITVVVGPNGSGKSNIVDAMKWVLGEQSAKSLRGKDMADVIFKGSGEGTRRMLNTAEATIIFENADSRLPVDAPEVHVTRRVYRSGEGEYLINGQPCRLKDIKHLFRGTGVGTDAYSLIEQGKVERMLQASPKDRRAIFEEAAGISRFKAKKVEAQRRLERVDQNLLRLSDIVEEVGSRLRTVRSQASKAKRFREYSDRLQQLRTQVGLTDWRHLSAELSAAEDELAGYRNLAGQQQAQAEAYEARSLELDVELTNIVESIRLDENHIARTREQIATWESAVDQGHARDRELAETESQLRVRLAGMAGRAGNVQSRLQETADQLQAATEDFQAVRQRVAEQEQAVGDSSQSLQQLRSEHEDLRRDHDAGMRHVAAVSSRISSHQSQLAALRTTSQRCHTRLEEIDTRLIAANAELGTARDHEQTHARQVAEQKEALGVLQGQLAEAERGLDERRERLGKLRQQFSAATERAAVIEELERNQEGLSEGVREVLELAQQADAGPFATVQGLVADLLHVSVDVAPMIDVALGDTAQSIAIVGDALLDEIQSDRFRPQSRVGFIRLDEPLPADKSAISWEGETGVRGRLDRLVHADPRGRALIARLLGNCWLVDSLSVALKLREASRGEVRFVTIRGAYLDADGTLLVGPRSPAASLVSRRSELRDLQERSVQLEAEIAEFEAQIATSIRIVEQHREAASQLGEQLGQTSDALAEYRLQTQSFHQRCEELERQQQSIEREREVANAEQETAAAELETARAELARHEASIAKLEQSIRDSQQRMKQLESGRDDQARELTSNKVELAKREQRLAALRDQMGQYEADHRERGRAIDEAQQQLTDCRQRQQRTRREILGATSELAELYLRRQQLTARVQRRLGLHEETKIQKGELAGQLQRIRREAQQRDEQQHRCELTAGQLRHQRDTLAERLREDYGIEIADFETDNLEQQEEREQVEVEIAQLRRKISNIGPVNMDALHELDDLDERYASLSSQYNDLIQAKESLERIVAKINADSRRLFQDTLEAIRANFQTLYRKAFGGGRADLVLEEGVDVLEAGVDIIATPPGKPSFNNSLLSGGEKALTAVSLLLAIFQYRPSPFCVLDEVDAPFDEANIGRFIDVLKGFLGWTKFVIVTHSKKTMTAATTLYGVTMQESGVSKRVSVRFEDVSEDGHISQEAIDRDSSPPDDKERGAA